MGEDRLLEAAYARLRDLLAEGTGFEIVPAARESPPVDAVWTLRSATGDSRLLVEAKTSIWPRDVDRVAEQLRKYAEAVDADRRLIVSPSLTERTRDLLRRAEIDYIDLRGAVRVSIPGRILIASRSEEDASTDASSYRRDRIANPFRGKASRLVRALLVEPDRWWGVTELAETVDVSAGLAVKTLKTLEDEAYVARSEQRKARLADGESLLRDWARAAESAFRKAERFTSSVRDPDELTTELTRGFERLGTRYALSRLAAARFIEPYAPAAVVDVYVEGDPKRIAGELDLLPVERGESVRLVRPPDAGVLQFTREQDGVTVVNPVQLFVDLSTAGGREPDVAERLFERRLRTGLLRGDEP